MTIQEQQPAIIQNFRMCFMRGCPNRGGWSPKISLSPDGIQYAHMRFRHWLMCDHHKNTIGLEDLIDHPLYSGVGAWEHIQLAFVRAGKTAPEREFTTLKWELA
tara:strand:- start:34254 stop:34565 length:312 start_codon:yes stop_codon:yes gene_type:complete